MLLRPLGAMNGWRGGWGANSARGTAGAPVKVGAVVLPSGIGWAGMAAPRAGGAWARMTATMSAAASEHLGAVVEARVSRCARVAVIASSRSEIAEWPGIFALRHPPC